MHVTSAPGDRVLRAHQPHKAPAAWVLRAASDTLVATGIPWMSVNVSAVQLRDAEFPELVLSTLFDRALAPSRLQLEITESTLIEDDTIVEASLSRLRAAGVRIALDDFGTGYSSMNYLRDYPVDKIKIDRSFVAELGTRSEADAIIRAIVALGRAMKKTVVAEGIETRDQMDHLAAIGCHELQGFYLSRPLSQDGLANLLEQQNLAASPVTRRGQVAVVGALTPTDDKQRVPVHLAKIAG